MVGELTLQSAGARRILERAAPVLEVVRGAAAADPELAESWHTNTEQRHTVQLRFTEALVTETDGPLRDGHEPAPVNAFTGGGPTTATATTSSAAPAARADRWTRRSSRRGPAGSPPTPGSRRWSTPSNSPASASAASPPRTKENCRHALGIRARNPAAPSPRLRELKETVRTLLGLDDGTAVMIRQLARTEPGCPHLETVVAVVPMDGPPRRWTLRQPADASTKDDLAAALLTPHPREPDPHH
ncbi:hypothetical protein [Streptomyces sp. DSM 40750]|uniref:hypothetical protein n=1 Tax=Streptomyces sp. DSM 40750 TaxID=2801030 RepID=UPI0027D47932|nr:hypothetical protein [Streptomyces sp. DSM 40750]